MRLFTATNALLFLFCFFLSWFGFFGVLTGVILLACFIIGAANSKKADDNLDELVDGLRKKEPVAEEIK